MLPGLFQGVERLAAVLALAALAPFLLITAVVIFVLSGRGPLVRHERAGWQGAPLHMLKFRTMWEPSASVAGFQMIEDVSGGAIPAVKLVADARVNSRFAAFCRRYSVDELPQLYHVAKGEMSLVGPRPITRTELAAWYGEAANEVLSIRPGLTGLWQTMGRSKLRYSQRKHLDLVLVRKASIRLYLEILWRSIPVVVGGDGAY